MTQSTFVRSTRFLAPVAAWRESRRRSSPRMQIRLSTTYYPSLLLFIYLESDARLLHNLLQTAHCP